MKTFILYPGCLISRRYPGFEFSALESARIFGIELLHNGSFTCCPDPVWMRSYNRDMWLRIAARNIAIAEEDATSLVTLCNGCFESLKSAHYLLKKDEKTRDSINQVLKKIGKEFKGRIEVKHLVQIFYEDIGEDAIRKKVVSPLEGLRFAVHPGCHLMRPSEEMEFDDPRNPVILEKLVRALGADVLDYEDKTACCGLPIFNSDRELSLSLAQKKINLLKDKVQGIVVSCPSCFMQFETVQTLKREEGGNPLPVYYYFELAALALGVEPEKIGLKNHRVNAEIIVEEIGK